MYIITSMAPKHLISDTIFSKYLLILDAYSKIPKMYGKDKVTTVEVMDNLDMFLSISGKIDEFGWWDIEMISADAG